MKMQICEFCYCLAFIASKSREHQTLECGGVKLEVIPIVHKTW